MDKKTTYFRQTTAQQRRLLFETWEATGNVSEACRKARVSRQTFYNWKERFQTDGNAGLEVPKSHAPNNPQKTPAEIQEQVINLRLENPQWGKRRITDEMAKANNWVPLVSPNTEFTNARSGLMVKRILRDAGLFPEPENKKGGLKTASFCCFDKNFRNGLSKQQDPLAWRRNHVKQ